MEPADGNTHFWGKKDVGKGQKVQKEAPLELPCYDPFIIPKLTKICGDMCPKKHSTSLVTMWTSHDLVKSSPCWLHEGMFHEKSTPTRGPASQRIPKPPSKPR